VTTSILPRLLRPVNARTDINRFLQTLPDELLSFLPRDASHVKKIMSSSLLALKVEVVDGSVLVHFAALIPCFDDNVIASRDILKAMLECEVGDVTSNGISNAPSMHISSRNLTKHPEPHGRRAWLVERPSMRELKVLALVKAGRRNREIAAILSVSEDTVKTRMKNVMGKLCATNRTHAVTIASERGLFDEFVDTGKTRMNHILAPD